MQWLKRSQVALLLVVLTVGCRMTGGTGSSSVWRRNERASITASLTKTPPKKEVKTEERPLLEQPKPKTPERERKSIPVKPDERPARKIVKAPDEEQSTAKPKKAPVDPEQTPEQLPESEKEKPTIRETIAAEESLMAEITGLIIEQTMTRIGYDFYEYFYIHWTPPLLARIDDYNIHIHERASPLWGSWVWVTVNDRIIWQKVLKPRTAESENAAKQAIEATTNYLTNYDQYAMNSEDMTGTGI
jgi:curli production assembly/transport component CsgE